jgi:hypothetical protein
VVKNFDKPPQLIDLSQDYMEKYHEQAGKLQNEELDYYLEHFTSLLKQIRWGESSRTFFKSSVIQALNYIVLDDRKLEKKARAWDARLDAIERKVNGTVPAGTAISKPAPGPEKDLDIISKNDLKEPARKNSPGIIRDEDAAREIKKGPGKGKKVEPKSTAPGNDGINSIENNMDRILDTLKKKKISVYAMFIEAGPGRIEDGILYFYLEETKNWHKDHLNKKVNLAIISSVINEVTGKKYGVKFETGEVKGKNGKNVVIESPPEEEEPPERISEPEPEFTGNKSGKKENKADKEKKNSSTAKNNPDKVEKKDDDVMDYFEKKFEIKE